MAISIFDLFSIGVGPSSSHTVGPMRAAERFVAGLPLEQVDRVVVELYGALSLTGRGHGIDKALVAGLQGQLPETVDVDAFNAGIEKVAEKKELLLAGKKAISFDESQLFVFANTTLEQHVNGMVFKAFDAAGVPLSNRTFYSIGGGFILEQGEVLEYAEPENPLPYRYDSAAQLLAFCEQEQRPISDITLANEQVWRTLPEIQQGLDRLIQVMHECIERGLQQEGVLPGGLNVKRRAPSLYRQLKEATKGQQATFENPHTMRWLNTFAMAVNEENAACGRVVTAPTNGAAGVIPAILYYLEHFGQGDVREAQRRMLLTAGAIGTLYKKNASISGAEVGCQGEVGVACSMAAAGLTEVLQGNIYQVENAAEMAMEHHLGLTCDPIAGLVQVPCIERNGLAAVRAMNVAQLALMEEGEHLVSLDKVIATMHKTGRDMSHLYKETALGGLAVNVIEC